MATEDTDIQNSKGEEKANGTDIKTTDTDDTALTTTASVESSSDRAATASYSPEPRNTDSHAPPLPNGDIPPLPDEAPPAQDDGWDAVWDTNVGAYYFYNRFTQATQWENPRIPEATVSSTPAPPPGLGAYDRLVSSTAPSSSSGAPGTSSPPRRAAGGYNPAIHGDYDPNADYAIEAQAAEEQEAVAAAAAADPTAAYAATGTFNRFTGKWQAATLTPENFNDENKSKRQMNAFFDVDAAANSHDGRSLKAERAGKKLSKQEVKAFRDKRREKKEEKRRAWLRD